MIRHIFILSVIASLAFILLATCSNPNRETKPAISPTEAELTMQSFFKALADADTTLLNQVTAEDFVLYEHDEIWNRDSLLSLMPQTSGRIWKIRDFESVSEGNMSHVYYYNVSQKPEGRSWLESALLARKGDSIKITFMHSTKLYLDN